ncbi:MAG TPA: hypothetical protein V6C98_06435 [Thermosynechococcaceae cyanobacterium]
MPLCLQNAMAQSAVTSNVDTGNLVGHGSVNYKTKPLPLGGGFANDYSGD